MMREKMEKNPKDCEECFLYIDDKCKGWDCLDCEEYQELFLKDRRDRCGQEDTKRTC